MKRDYNWAVAFINTLTPKWVSVTLQTPFHPYAPSEFALHFNKGGVKINTPTFPIWRPYRKYKIKAAVKELFEYFKNKKKPQYWGNR